MKPGNRKRVIGEPAFIEHPLFSNSCPQHLVQKHLFRPHAIFFPLFSNIKIDTEGLIRLLKVTQDKMFCTQLATWMWPKDSTSSLWFAAMLWSILCRQPQWGLACSSALSSPGETSQLRRQQLHFASNYFPQQLLFFGEQIDVLIATQRPLTYQTHFGYWVLYTLSVFFNFEWKYGESGDQNQWRSPWKMSQIWEDWINAQIMNTFLCFLPH